MSHRSTKKKLTKMELLDRVNSKEDSVFQNATTTSEISLSELEENINLPKAVKSFEGYKSIKRSELMETNKLRRSKEGCDFCSRNKEDGCCSEGADCHIFKMKVETYEEFNGKTPSNDSKPAWHPCYNCPKYNSSCNGIFTIHQVNNPSIYHNIDYLLGEGRITREIYDLLIETGITEVPNKLFKRIENSWWDNPIDDKQLLELIADKMLYNPEVSFDEKKEGNNLKLLISKTKVGYEVKIKNTKTTIFITKNYILVDGKVTDNHCTRKYFKDLLGNLPFNIPEKIIIKA